MSIYGTNIYSDEFASWVRDEYRKLVGFGISDEESEECILKYFGNFIKSEYGTMFWLSLALSEWNIGRLSELVKEKAIEVIDSGEDLEKWKLAIKHEESFSKTPEKYNYSLLNDVAQNAQTKYQEANGIEKIIMQQELKNIQGLLNFCNEGSIREESLPIPSECIEIPFLFDILMINSKAKKKYELRKRELENLKTTLSKPQIYKKVSRPYFFPSPWEEGDIVAMKLKDLKNDLHEFNETWALFHVISVQHKPVSSVLPNIASDDEIIVGLFNHISDEVLDKESIKKAQYIPFHTKNKNKWGLETTKAIRLSLYGSKREIAKWDWKVIDCTPDIASELPEFFLSGSVGMLIKNFGDEFAKIIASAILESYL